MDKSVKALSGFLMQFVRWEIETFSWSNATGRKAADKADFSVSFSRRDLAGHIRCEVTLRVDDVSGHGCCFYVDKVEDTQLERLARQLDAMELYDRA
jgi:hypothetical protein